VYRPWKNSFHPGKKSRERDKKFVKKPYNTTNAKKERRKNTVKSE